MSVKELVDSAAEMTGKRVIGSGANRAFQTVPKHQSKIRGILMVATAIMLISAGLKMLKNRNK